MDWHWLRPTALGLAFLPLACSSGDSSNTIILEDASQGPVTKYEAGAPCLSDNDCASGLVCLHPVTSCSAPSVCVAAPPSPCDSPQPACSCLAETVTVCHGYSADPIESLGPCGEGGTPTPIPDAGADAPAPADASSGKDSSSPVDSSPGGDSSASVDAGPGIDASDASGD